MREFLFKSSFIRFYCSLVQGKPNNGNSSEAGLTILFSLLMFFGVFFGGSFVVDNVMLNWICVVIFFAFAFSLIYGMKMRNKPNLVSLQPISHAKKSVWYALMPLFTIFLWLVFVCVTMLVIYAIVRLVWVCIGYAGEPFFDEEEYNAFTGIGTYGGLFILFYFILSYGTGIAAGLTERKLYRNVGLTVLVVLNALTFILISAFTPQNAAAGSLTVFGGCSPFLAESYNIMPNLWVVLLVLGIAAAALAGLAVYKVVTYFKPKKY